jgi:uncharacterized protein (TIGR00375 family)
MILPTMARIGKIKGLDILSASDWTHPLWFKEIQAQLVEAEEGVYKLKNQSSKIKTTTQNPKIDKEIYFILSTEISSIYKDKDKLRRIHNLVFTPDLKTAERITKALMARGANLMADGRPIIGLSSHNLLELILSIDERAFLIPCHVWTPHFGLYGSASGYDSIEESFEELSKYIYGIETGLSSDPEMNWQMQELKNRSILSFSDAHSPLKMGREATVLDLAEPTFANLKEAIMRKSKENRIVYSVEFYPEEGKYHYSGHRNCNIVLGPEEIGKDGQICPVCNRRLTEGVMYRVQTLAGTYEKTAVEKENNYGLKWFTDKKKNHPPYVKLVPLLEIVAEALGSTVASQKVKDLFYTACRELGSELDILLKTPLSDIKALNTRLGEGIEKVRKGTISINPGYDNVYGTVKIWSDNKTEEKKEEGTDTQLGLEL